MPSSRYLSWNADARGPSKETRTRVSLLVGGLYLHDPPLDAVDDLMVSAGAVLPVSLSPMTRRGLCSCFA